MCEQSCHWILWIQLVHILRRYTVSKILLIGYMSLISDDAISVPCILLVSRFEFGVMLLSFCFCVFAVTDYIYFLLVVTTAQIYNRFLVTNGITNVSGQVMQAIYRAFSTNHNERKACTYMHAHIHELTAFIHWTKLMQNPLDTRPSTVPAAIS